MIVVPGLGGSGDEHWQSRWAHGHQAQVRAALLVAPPDIDRSAARGAPIAGFGPWPRGEQLLRDLLARTRS